MAKKQKMTITRLPLTGAKTATPLDPLRHGMPALDSIHETVKFTPKAKGPSYTIMRSTETDAYEDSAAATALSKVLAGTKAPSAKALAAAMKAKAPTGDNFAGTARKAAKLSIPQAPIKPFSDVKDLVASLPPDKAMINHNPRITTTATSGRVKEEQRNIHVSGYLYAASREADNDFHLIVGRDPKLSPALYMTMEVSGLPPTSYPAYASLNAARNAFKNFFGAHLPALTYDFYDPPIPVTIEGSPFFDMTHATGQAPGPPSLKSRMPTIWEVHPVSSIKLGP
jgi:hypothetical protein